MMNVKIPIIEHVVNILYYKCEKCNGLHQLYFYANPDKRIYEIYYVCFHLPKKQRKIMVIFNSNSVYPVAEYVFRLLSYAEFDGVKIYIDQQTI